MQLHYLSGRPSEWIIGKSQVRFFPSFPEKKSRSSTYFYKREDSFVRRGNMNKEDIALKCLALSLSSSATVIRLRFETSCWVGWIYWYLREVFHSIFHFSPFSLSSFEKNLHLTANPSRFIIMHLTHSYSPDPKCNHVVNREVYHMMQMNLYQAVGLKCFLEELFITRRQTRKRRLTWCEARFNSCLKKETKNLIMPVFVCLLPCLMFH